MSQLQVLNDPMLLRYSSSSSSKLDPNSSNDGTTENRLVPVQVVGITSGATQIVAGWCHTCAVVDVGGVSGAVVLGV